MPAGNRTNAKIPSTPPPGSHIQVTATMPAIPLSLNLPPQYLSQWAAANSIIKRGHYVVPDTSVLLHSMDVLEHASAFHDVVPQVGLEEARARSLPLYIARLLQCNRPPGRPRGSARSLAATIHPLPSSNGTRRQAVPRVPQWV